MASEGVMDYKRIYELLYSIGYHSKQKNHGKKWVKYLTTSYSFDSVLEIGCSNGVAVRAFRSRGINAYGLDASEIAIRMCAEGSFVPNCIVASATDVPFIDNFVDAVYSCDVYEHLTEDDVIKAIKEAHRLTKKYFFIVLDCQIEGNREWITKAKEKFPNEFEDIDNLHVTVWPEYKWKNTIESHGFKYINKISDLYCFEKI